MRNVNALDVNPPLWAWILGILIMFGMPTLIGCSARRNVPVVSRTGAGATAVHDGKYYFICVGDNCLVVAQSNTALDAAQKDLGCGVCSNEHMGEAYSVHIITKKGEK